MNSRLFLTEFENILAKTIMKRYPLNWDEDHITRSILEEMQDNFSTVRIFGYSRRMRIDWQIYKQRGTNHYNYGDVAILVRITHQDRDMLEGAAFLEAKKRSLSKISFDEIKQEQLEKINQHSQSAMALLYDYEDITQFANIESSLNMKKWFAWKPCTHCVVVPLRLILVSGKHDTSIYKYSLPFSYQLFYRYFNGFDLDFTESALLTAKGFAEKENIPKYIVVASVAFGEVETKEGIGVNRDVFEPINSEPGTRKN